MLNFFTAFFGGVCIFFSCVNLLPERLSGRHSFLLFLWILTSSCVLFPLIGQAFTFIILFVTLILIYIFSSAKWLNLCCALFGYLFAVTLNYFCIWIWQMLWNMTLEQIYQISSRAIFLSAFYCCLCWICTYLLGYLLNRQWNIASFLSDAHLCIAIFTDLLILTVLFVFNFSYGENIGYSYGVTAFNGILFLAAFVLSATLLWFLYRNIRQKEQAKSRLKQYEKLQDYTQELERLYGTMRAFKHDYINILSTMAGYMEDGDMEMLKDYFYQAILPVSRKFSESDTKLGRLSQIQCPELKSLISSKLIYALELGLHIELELPDPVESCAMQPVDISRVMGIFLDNAIDAALKTEEKKIHLCMLREPESLVIILKNSALPPPMPIATLNRLGVSGKGEDRGIGLYNAKSIIDQYSQVLWDTDYQAPWFTQTLTIFHGKEPS